jgi:hypothetical protein
MRCHKVVKRKRNGSPRVNMEFGIVREDVLITLNITGTVYPFIPAKTHGLPEDCYPEEGGNVELENVEVSDISYDGRSVQSINNIKVGDQLPNLTDDERNSIEEVALEEAAHNEEAAYEYACETAYDFWKEGS